MFQALRVLLGPSVDGTLTWLNYSRVVFLHIVQRNMSISNQQDATDLARQRQHAREVSRFRAELDNEQSPLRRRPLSTVTTQQLNVSPAQLELAEQRRSSQRILSRQQREASPHSRRRRGHDENQNPAGDRLARASVQRGILSPLQCDPESLGINGGEDHTSPPTVHTVARRDSSSPLGNGQALKNISVNRRSLAQRRRRERERLQQNQEAWPTPPQTQPSNDSESQHPTSSATTTSTEHQLSRRAIAQRQRRERERQERQSQNQNSVPRSPAPDNAGTYPTPPSTQAPRGPVELQRCADPPRDRNINVLGITNHDDRTSQVGPGHAQRTPNSRRANGQNSKFLAARRPYREPVPRHDLGRMDVECPKCGALHWKDERLANSSVSSPMFGMCCKSGKVQLPDFCDPPNELKALLDGDGPQAREFRDNIWKYNRAFAFTSMKVKEDHSVNRRGPPIFRIQGELFHHIGPLEPSSGHNPTYSQLYIYDPRAALEHRQQQNSGLNPDTLRILQRVMQNHQYAQAYQHAHEILRGYDPNEDVTIHLRVLPSQDRRRYNLPTADEVAVILPQTATADNARDIVLHRRSGGLRIISDLHPAYSPLYYVLLFPYGENGWHPNMQLTQQDGTEKRLTQLRYVAYYLYPRRNKYSTILRGGRLLQRYLVDMYAIIDQNRLRFLFYNQPMLRASLYSGLEDAVAFGDDEIDLSSLGQRYILPSSYIGGPRHMQQRFQDAMAIARYFRRVDLFLTVTCNPNWAEITRELLPGQTPYDRPDLVARVFQLKKKAIIEEIFKHGIFGHVAAYVYTIEFQKRGLPHMHSLIFLKEPHKLTTVEAIDSCIWARWPDPEKEPHLFEIVKQCMVHGPCAGRSDAVCMEEGKCKRHYPKEFSEATVMDEDGFPRYYRPNDGRVYMVNGIPTDNRWLVAYPPYFIARFECHANSECAVSLGSFKYLFKYAYKGGDMVSLEEVNRNNEIQRYLDGRYVSASEAAHRIFEFEMHAQVPNVVRLQVHLPGQHLVIFDPNEDPAVLLARASNETTTLTAWFKANADPGPVGQEARKYTYQEFPQHFRWVQEDKKWVIRKQGFALGRMYYVPPTAGERFYLRLLLTVVKGATSFEDLRIYDRPTPYNTFYETCRARGLLEDDGEWEQCLREASFMQVGSRLRHLFVTILLFCEPSRPEHLWQHFRQHICDDLRHRLQTLGLPDPSDEEVYDYGLYLLQEILKKSGHTLDDWPSMPKPQIAWEERRMNGLIAEQLNYNRLSERTYYEHHLPLLNEDQRRAFDRITSAIDNSHAELFFVNGPGGTGKTFLYKVICSKYRGEGAVVVCVASSGIAALLLPLGRTAHSTFKIPIENLHEDSVCNISKNSQRADLLRMAKLIIWDEVGAQHRHAIEALDRTLRDVRDDERPFAGLTAIFGGDFQQTLPVVPRGSREEVVDATLIHSELWKDIEVLHLRQNMRLRGDPEAEEFSKWLLDIGHGRNSNTEGKVEIPDDMIVQDPTSLIDFIYPQIEAPEPPPPDYFLDRMILAPRNSDVSDINDDILDRMAGDTHIFHSANEVIHEEGADGHDDLPLTPECLRSINAANLPPGELRIKKGCPLILLRNLSPSQGLCNGTRVIVTNVGSRVLEVRVMGGDHDGEVALIPRISLTSTASSQYTFKIRRRQYPVRLAFALTINKAQGQSVKYVGLDLRVPAFGHGQLYVALTRATSRSRVKILLADASETSTTNVVYPEVLVD